MIPQTPRLRQVEDATPDSWQQQLANLVRDPKELFRLLDLNLDKLPAALAANKDFALRVPRPYLNRIEPRNWQDPLLLQVLPLGEELAPQPGFSHDPLAEKDSNPIPGLIHKYAGRVLMVVAGSCAINCRYCFRRHFPYQENKASRQDWQTALNYIAERPDIHEVIFSGGDPLVASDKMLASLVSQISDIPHVHTLRIHSRLPIVLPQRITDSCLAWMTESRLQPVMVVHCNHANEIDGEVAMALQTLKAAGVTLLNQSVLLAGVNNEAKALIELSHALFRVGVLPYYLHSLDKVQGAAHFQVPESEGLDLIAQLRNRLPGYLVPKFVKECPHELSKVPI